MGGIAPQTREILKGFTGGTIDVLAGAAGLQERQLPEGGLDRRTLGLVKVAALIALGAPPAAYGWQVRSAIEAGATPEDILDVLIAVAPQVGGPRVIAAAPELMGALGLDAGD